MLPTQPTTGTRARRTLTGLALALVLAGCSSPQPAGVPVSGEVTTAGSSTVGPLTKAIASRYKAYQPGVEVSVGVTSTGEGFGAFCSGTLDIANASRRIEPDEKAACERVGIGYTEVLVANDAISVVVNPANTWAKCLTMAELKKLWEPAAAGSVRTWKDVRESFPAEPLGLFGPDSTSGTLDVFTLAVTGAEKAIRSDYRGSLDDTATVSGVRDAKGGVGFLGYSYVLEAEDVVRAVSIDSGRGCVAPTPPTVEDGSYGALARPLFIYVSNGAAKDKPQVRSFVEYYVQWARNVAEDSNFVPVTEAQREQARTQLSQILNA